MDVPNIIMFEIFLQVLGNIRWKISSFRIFYLFEEAEICMLLKILWIKVNMLKAECKKYVGSAKTRMLGTFYEIFLKNISYFKELLCRIFGRGCYPIRSFISLWFFTLKIINTLKIFFLESRINYIFKYIFFTNIDVCINHILIKCNQ